MGGGGRIASDRCQSALKIWTSTFQERVQQDFLYAKQSKASCSAAAVAAASHACSPIGRCGPPTPSWAGPGRACATTLEACRCGKDTCGVRFDTMRPATRTAWQRATCPATMRRGACGIRTRCVTAQRRVTACLLLLRAMLRARLGLVGSSFQRWVVCCMVAWLHDRMLHGRMVACDVVAWSRGRVLRAGSSTRAFSCTACGCCSSCSRS
jgi:hypothetical protein